MKRLGVTKREVAGAVATVVGGIAFCGAIGAIQARKACERGSVCPLHRGMPWYDRDAVETFNAAID